MTAKPIRIQRKRTRGWRMPVGAIHVGRPGRWSNPWTIARAGSAEVAVATFRAAMIANPENLNAVRRDLAGHDLACWCPLDQPCHADVLLELANADPAYLHEIRTAPAFSSPSTGGTSTVPEVASLRTGSGVAGPTNVKLSAHT